MNKIDPTYMHTGFSDKLLRDYFSKQLTFAFWDKMSNEEIIKRREANSNLKGLDKDLAAARLDLDIAIDKVKRIEKQITIQMLISERGWIAWDISDYSIRGERNLYYPFIGTENEYITFLKENDIKISTPEFNRNIDQD